MANNFSAGPPAADVIRPLLSANEALLWAGRPRPGINITLRDLPSIAFGLFFAAFASMFIATALGGGAPSFFALFPLLHLGVGLYVAGGRFVVDAQRRARTVYGVTSERVVIVSDTLRRNVTSLSLDTLASVSLRQSERTGTVYFGPEPDWQNALGWSKTATSPALELGPDAKAVYDIVVEAQRARRRTPHAAT